MNSVCAAHEQLQQRKNETALWMPHHGTTSFGELDQLALRSEHAIRSAGVKSGEAVLLALDLSPLMYAVIIALARMGCTLVLVEPWMPLARIQTAVEMMKPTAIIAQTLGFLWGLRVSAIRRIPRRISKSMLLAGQAKPSTVASLDLQSPFIITFTSGTTGIPKGVVRTHGYLLEQTRVVSKALQVQKYRGADLCIFANLALANLAAGRPSLVMPSRWHVKDIRQLNSLPPILQPKSMVSGPAFLQKLMQECVLPGLEAVFVGGALTDCSVFERAFARWQKTAFTHVYGGTEVEPVAFGDAREAVKRSRAEGFFQTLYVGQQHPEIEARRVGEQLWVAGPHVCPEYLGDVEANHSQKSRDADGKLWHRMGDRILEKDQWLVYQGREQQVQTDFLLEQRLYAALGSSAAMIERTSSGALNVYAEEPLVPAIRSVLPEVNQIYRVKIKRDRRHRSRIDREQTKKGREWRVG